MLPTKDEMLRKNLTVDIVRTKSGDRLHGMVIFNGQRQQQPDRRDRTDCGWRVASIISGRQIFRPRQSHFCIKCFGEGDLRRWNDFLNNATIEA